MFSVVRDTRPVPLPGREVGRGSAEAVPGTPFAVVLPLESSVRCEVAITEWAGS